MKKIIVIGIIVIVVIWLFASRGAEQTVEAPATAPETSDQTATTGAGNGTPATGAQTAQDTVTAPVAGGEEVTAAGELAKTLEVKKAQVHYFTKGNLELCANDTVPLERALDEKFEFASVAALVELTKPLPQAFVDQGYATAFETGTRLMNLRIDREGNASADFNEKLNVNVGTCGVAQRRAQIVNTLKEFSGVKAVTITIGEEVWE